MRLMSEWTLRTQIQNWTLADIEKYKDLVERWADNTINGIKRCSGIWLGIANRVHAEKTAEITAENKQLRARVAQLEQQQPANNLVH